MKKLTFLFISLLSVLNISATVYSGSCGTNARYTLDTTTGVLSITGTGAMTDYSSKKAPWYSQSSYIKTIEIADGITSIGQSAFTYCKYCTSITVPKSITSIGIGAFASCSSLTSITIPNGVTSIGTSVFSNCSSLTSIIIPNSVTEIGVSAFSYCTSLTSITIPNNVTSIGMAAFYGCSSLTSITISNNITSIEVNTFAGCSSLTAVTIPKNVTSIGKSAFAQCIKLASVTIPNSVTSIGETAFDCCTALTSITIPNSVTSIGISAFNGAGLTSVSIPNSVTSIEGGSFASCLKLTSVTIPNSVTSIESSAFSGCKVLTEVYCFAESVPTTNSNVFDNSNTNYATLYVPESSIAGYKAAKPWRYFGNIVALPDVPTTQSIEINEINFPDENFRNWILSQTYGSDGKLTENEIAEVKSINVCYKEIQSLQGIEHFTALVSLYCYGNKLTSFDISKNTALETLNCSYCGLTSLDVSFNTALKDLQCYSNPLKSLDVSKNTALESLSCYYNQLTTLDVSHNTALKDLQCCTNKLTSLDLSNNTALTTLHCYVNQLTSLELSHNTQLTTLGCYSNMIKDNEMDALVNSLPTVSNGRMDVLMNYKEEDGNAMTTTQVKKAKAKGWTPYHFDPETLSWVEYAGSEPKKCATPIIIYNNGKVMFYCATEGVKYNYSIVSSVEGCDNILTLPTSCKISVYATKEGYEPSDPFTQEISMNSLIGKLGDVNKDGKINMQDAMFIVNYILKGNFPNE